MLQDAQHSSPIPGLERFYSNQSTPLFASNISMLPPVPLNSAESEAATGLMQQHQHQQQQQRKDAAAAVVKRGGGDSSRVLSAMRSPVAGDLASPQHHINASSSSQSLSTSSQPQPFTVKVGYEMHVFVAPSTVSPSAHIWSAGVVKLE